MDSSTKHVANNIRHRTHCLETRINNTINNQHNHQLYSLQSVTASLPRNARLHCFAHSCAAGGRPPCIGPISASGHRRSNSPFTETSNNQNTCQSHMPVSRERNNYGSIRQSKRSPITVSNDISGTTRNDDDVQVEIPIT